MCWVVSEGEGGLGGYQPGVYVPLNALFLVMHILSFRSTYRRI